MGDASDMADIERLLRSEEGKAYLQDIRSGLKNRSVIDVSFENETRCLTTSLHLDDGNVFEAIQPGHDVEALRESFREVIDREFYKDYPERKP